MNEFIIVQNLFLNHRQPIHIAYSTVTTYEKQITYIHLFVDNVAPQRCAFQTVSGRNKTGLFLLLLCTWVEALHVWLRSVPTM
jgi:hypothetical protein